MNTKILGLLAVALLAGPMAANAAIISGTWTFTSGAYSGSFSFAGLDTSQVYVDSTAAGFSVSTNFDTSGNGGNAFSYSPNIFVIGGLVNGITNAAGSVNDWWVYTFDFPNLAAGFFAYYPAVGSVVPITTATFQATSVPEPGTLALLGLGLVGMGYARHRKAS